MDIAMTTAVTPTVAASRLRTETLSALGNPVAQPLPWHGGVARTAPFTGRSAVAGTRTNAKQPHPPRGVPR